jgi:hypothetical protein
MELWDRNATDLLGPAFIEIGSNGRGSVRFIAVDGRMDVREAELGERPGIEFSWEGNDKCDPTSGRG